MGSRTTRMHRSENPGSNVCATQNGRAAHGGQRDAVMGWARCSGGGGGQGPQQNLDVLPSANSTGR